MSGFVDVAFVRRVTANVGECKWDCGIYNESIRIKTVVACINLAPILGLSNLICHFVMAVSKLIIASTNGGIVEEDNSSIIKNIKQVSGLFKKLLSEPREKKVTPFC